MTALREDGYDLRLFGSMYCGTLPPGIFHLVFHVLSGDCYQLSAILTFPESVFPKNPVGQDDFLHWAFLCVSKPDFEIRT